MKILHVVPGLDEPTNGIAVAAKLIAGEQSKSGAEVEVVETGDFVQSNIQTFEHCSEVWVHSMWLPQTMRACWKVLRLKKSNIRCPPPPNISTSSPFLVRMPHANLDPVRLAYHGWKKRIVALIERWLFSKTDRVVVTCEAEKEWCERWGLRNEFEVVDLKRFFRLGGEGNKAHAAHSVQAERIPLLHSRDALLRARGARLRPSEDHSLHLLYLGRRHPLKGVEYLKRAVEELNGEAESFPLQEEELSLVSSGKDSASPHVQLRIVSDHFGEDLERDWEWCDVLCLPTLSENFGLVVAEALEREKRVITTDGAPAWEPRRGLFDCSVESGHEGRLMYLQGFREGTDKARVKLLKDALERFANL